MNARSCWPLLLIALLFSCSGNRLNVDVSKVSVPAVKIDRMEKDLFGSGSGSIKGVDENLKKKYGSFYTTFLSMIGSIKPDSSALSNLGMYASDPIMKEAYIHVQIGR